MLIEINLKFQILMITLKLLKDFKNSCNSMNKKLEVEYQRAKKKRA